MNQKEELHILLVVPRLNIGGAETYVVTTALGLKKHGYRVTVASWGGQLTQKLRLARINHYLVPIRFSPTLAAKMLSRIIRQHDIDIVHANSAAAGFAALQACQQLNKPLVYTAHGVFGHNSQEKALGEADRIICVSDFLRQLSIEKGINPTNLITLHSGIDLTQFSPDTATKKAARQRLGITKDQFVLGIVSRIKNLNDKGHQDLLQLLSRYQNETAKWKLLVIGKGKGFGKLKAAIQHLGLTDRVILAGHHTDIPTVMQAMDLLVLPSVFETFGLVLIEAMALNIPAISYAVGGTPEAIEDGRTGFLVPKGDIATLYAKIRLLSDNESLRLKLGTQGRNRVLTNFNSELMLDRLETIYHQLVQKKG
jgi:glycosyltransferase involved in cell wall biosynthesis